MIDICTITTKEALLDKMKQSNGFMCFMPEDVYRAAPAVNQSSLCEYRHSPAHYQYALKNQREDTKDMMLGRAIHKYILEGADMFQQEYLEAPKFDKRTKKGKEDAAKWEQENGGKQALNKTDYDYVTRLSEGFLENKKASRYIRGGLPELKGFVKDAETELWLKIAIDCTHITKDVLVDLKTTQKKATPDSFRHSVMNYQYHVQQAFYSDVFEAITGKRVKAFIFMVLEKNGPFASRPMVLPESIVEKGRTSYRKWLKIHEECLTNNYWPSYEPGVCTIAIPPWVEDIL